MPLKLIEMADEEMTKDGVFKDVVDAEWDAYQDPYTLILNLLFPIKGEGPEAHNKRIADSLIQQLDGHKKAGPVSQWIRVVDSETGEIAGAAQWSTFEENPFATPSEDEITWWPAGEEREFAKAIFDYFLNFRMTYLQKPHMHLEVCFVTPKYRRQGVGRLLMDWGVQKADRLGMESYLDSTPMGVPLYEQYGYVSPGWVHVKAPENTNPSARWKVLEATLVPFEFLPMWRPVGGKVDENTKKPWESG